MRLTVLGCSGSVGGPGAACSGYLLSVPGEQPVLVDCGPGVFGELQRVTDPNNVAVVLSHLHADHCLDLPAMLVWRRYAPQPARRRAPLYGPPGTALRIGYGSSEFPGQLDDITDTFDVHEWSDDQEITLGGMRIRAMNVNHPPDTFGLRITGPDGQVIAARGDDRADRAAVEGLVDLERRDVGLHVVHAATHVRVDAHDGVTHEQFAVAEGGEFPRLEAEVVGRRRALRARGEDDLAGGRGDLGHRRSVLHDRAAPPYWRIPRRAGR